jgi:hypothetical protein
MFHVKHRRVKRPPILLYGGAIMDKKNAMFHVGLNCQTFRRNRTNYSQPMVAKELGFSVENISSFENSRNDNYYILLWYIQHGMTVEELLEGIE